MFTSSPSAPFPVAAFGHGRGARVTFGAVASGAMLVSVLMAGCGPLRPVPPECSEQPLCLMFCEHGFATDANGCPTCSCLPADPNDGGPIVCPAMACAEECPNGVVTGEDGCPTCGCLPATGCWSDSDCPADQRCDLVNFCDPPPGCDPGENCPAVCYGRCVASIPECGGAWLDENGTCRSPWDGVYPPECCHPAKPCSDGSEIACDSLPPTCRGDLVVKIENGCYAGCVDPITCEPMRETCDDGSLLMCRMMVPDCAPGFVAAIIDGCYQCREVGTCQQACATDSDCDAGERCTEQVFDPCANVDPNGPQCGAPVSRYLACRPASCGDVMCDLWCPTGFAIDPATGCPTCSCNPDPNGCVCDELYAPVCGVDGNTYSNACFAACANVSVASQGECGPTCEIECFAYQPVCGADGVTYGCGEADARCHGTTVAYDGECGPTCEVDCVRYQPVCGADGVTYGCGEADARCHHTTVAYEGECAPSCICTREYNPQCGTDGHTYGNPCEARCANATIAHAGECAATCTSNADCSWGQKCFGASSDATIAPSTGRCVAAEYCEADTDCAGLAPTQSCVGNFACVQNTCAYRCSR